MAVHIPFSTHHPQNLLHLPWRSSPACPLQTPANVTAHLCLPALAALPSCPVSLPAPAPPGTLEGNAGEGSGPPFCLWSRRGRGREGIVPLPHIASMLGLKAVTYGIHITSGRGLILPGGLWMPRKHGLLSREVCHPSPQKYMARGNVFRGSSKCHCPFLARLCDISNIKYYL